VGRLAIWARSPEVTRYRFDDLTELEFALPQCLLGALAFGQVEHESDALIPALVEVRRTHHRGHTAPVLPEILLFVRL
jgi:hypothetical protein